MENTGAKKRKFNIVDLIFILIIVAALAVIGIKLIGNARSKAAAKSYVVVLESWEFPKATFENGGFKEGDTVLDAVGKHFGKVTRILDYGEAHWDENAARDVAGRREDYASVKIEVEVEGSLTGNFLYVGSNKYNINSSYAFNVGLSNLWLRVVSITPVQ